MRYQREEDVHRERVKVNSFFLATLYVRVAVYIYRYTLQRNLSVYILRPMYGNPTESLRQPNSIPQFLNTNLRFEQFSRIFRAYPLASTGLIRFYGRINPTLRNIEAAYIRPHSYTFKISFKQDLPWYF